MEKENEKLLRKIPSVDSMLKDEEIKGFSAGVPMQIVADAVREAIEKTRQLLIEEKQSGIGEKTIYEQIIAGIKERISSFKKPYYRRAINATGIILHTGLGRAVLPAAAMRQIREELSGYSLVQLDIETGKRSRRDERIEVVLQKLTGAEAATIVNNNSAATAIVLNTVGKGKEVIVSRGQLVEIGGSFRLPDVMALSGAKLVEVGTTNRTHSYDYERAINENTAAILRVHPSNYKISGFTAEVALEELVRIAHSKGLVMIDDVGAGALIDFSRYGFAKEPTIQDSIKAGADIVTSSADKLIGASQAGIIVGKANLINAIRKNQFARIVRAGKLTLAALEATLKLFFDEQSALTEIPTLRMMTRNQADTSRQARKIVSELKKGNFGAEIETVEGFSQVGSGSMPEQNLATTLAAIKPKSMSIEGLALNLRRYNPPIFARISDERLLIDPRTLLEGDDKILIKALLEILGG